MGVPALAVIEVPMGLSRERIVEPEQVSDPYALSRFCVTVSANEDWLSPPARIRFLIARQSRVPSCALSSAATPVTWGVAIEVPLNVLYVLPGVVLRIWSPGAPR